MITVMSSFYSVGAVLSALLAIAVIPQWGWQAVFYVAVLPESAAFLALKGRRAELDQLLVKVDPGYRPGTELGLAALSLAALGFKPGPLLLNLLLLIAGATTIGTLAVIHAYASISYPAHIRSTGVGWAAGIGRLGAIAGPMLGGSLLTLEPPFQQNFLAFALPGVIGALAIVLIHVRLQPSVAQLDVAGKTASEPSSRSIP
jgi:MFS family permease